ncbi:MAG TPA: alkaline phosphatase, partial [Rhodothermales bacterium]|nr:alkaline phosphatase [Rhodothermales bacterium]
MRALRRSVLFAFLAITCQTSTYHSGAFAASVPEAYRPHTRHLEEGVEPPARPRNVILFVSDGMGPAAVTMTRDYVNDVLGGSGLTLDEIEVGSIRTRSTSSRVTDSAAGATAYAAGVHTYNGAISVDTLKHPVGTVLEAAETRGMATGLVVTCEITDATPAAFASHVPERSMQHEIAAQMLDHGVEVLFGGGASYFLTEGGSRRDGRDLIEEARTKGYQVVRDKDAFMGSLRAPVLGLFADAAMGFDIDRDTTQLPSLAQMAKRAIDLLDDDPDGFFLMVEASFIDVAGHQNDPAPEVQDVRAYDEAMEVAVTYARRTGNTLIVGTSDHETGGLSLGRDGIYQWNPAVLSHVTASADRIV